MDKNEKMALFRLSVLGPLASRDFLERGELKQIIKELSGKTYDIPGSKRNFLTDKTIEHWYYAWKRGGYEALFPRRRKDSGETNFAM